MEEKPNKESSNSNDKNTRPPFTAVDWIIGAFSIALLVYIIANLPAY